MQPLAEVDHIAERLRDLARDGSSFEAAQVKLIGLDEIREAAGARWPQMRQRVRDGSLLILSRHAGPNDVVLPAGDGFLIIMAESDPERVQARCRAMREALFAFYLGEDALKSLKPEVQARTLNAAGLKHLIAARRPAPAPPSEEHHTLALAPAFVVHDKRVGVSICAPVIIERRLKRIGYDPDFLLDGRRQTPADYLDLDLALLDEAQTQLTAARETGRLTALGLSVHSSTLQHRKSREHYLAWLERIDTDLRRRLIFVIAEIEKGTPFISIAEWSAALRTQLGHVWLDFHFSDHAITGLNGAGALAAGFQLPGATATGTPRGERMIEQIAFWSRTLRSQGMRFFVSAVPDHAFAAEAARLGVDFAVSDALWPFQVREHACRNATSETLAT